MRIDEQLLAAAELAVSNIIVDMSDRAGLGNEWDEIDDNIQKEIKEEWVNLVFQQLKSQLDKVGE